MLIFSPGEGHGVPTPPQCAFTSLRPGLLSMRAETPGKGGDGCICGWWAPAVGLAALKWGCVLEGQHTV